MTKGDEYRRKLLSLSDWTPYLLRESGLPGPRANLELAQAAAELADKHRIAELLSRSNEAALEDSPRLFLFICGLVALGKHGDPRDARAVARLRQYASDPRWRVREALAMALQSMGDRDLQGLVIAMRRWRRGSWLEKRAVAAALAEPRLLRDVKVASQVLQMFDAITSEIEADDAPASEEFRICRQTMGYAWSVAVAALPALGKALMEKWFKSRDPNVHWVMRENLKKSRLSRMDAGWVKRWSSALDQLNRRRPSMEHA